MLVFNVFFVLSWHFVLVLVVMFILGIVFFVCSFSGFGVWCFDVEFLLALLCFHVVLALRCSSLIVLSFLWVAVVFVVGYLCCGMYVSKLRLW